MPEPDWAPDECGKPTPAWAQAIIVKPEQSKCVGSGSAVNIGIADLGHGIGHRRGRASGRWHLRGQSGAPSASGQDRLPLLFLQAVEQILGLGQGGIDLGLFGGGTFLGGGDLGRALRGGLAADVERLQLGGVLGVHVGLEVVERRHRRQVIQERRGVIGDDDLTDGREALTLILANDGVLDLRLHAVQPAILPPLVSLQRIEVLGEVLELQLDVVVTLRRLFGLVEKSVHAGLDIIDVGVRPGGVCRHKADRSSGHQGGDGSLEALPAV